jgi:predicted NodU family carbamoyl transferase
MFILGLNSAYHESSACLVKAGQIVAAVAEEREIEYPNSLGFLLNGDLQGKVALPQKS